MIPVRKGKEVVHDGMAGWGGQNGASAIPHALIVLPTKFHPNRTKIAEGMFFE